MKKLLCFDLDNTLIQSDKAHTHAYNEALELNGFKKGNPKTMKNLYGRSHVEIIKILTKNKANSTQIEKIYKAHQYLLATKYSTYARPFPGIITLLKKLKKDYALVLASNCNTVNILSLLQATKIPENLFSAIIGHDQVKHSKPYPDEIFKAEHLTHRKAFAMIGDSIYDMRAARKAKVKGIAVLTGNYSKNALQQEKPYIILKNLNSLPKLLNKLEEEQ